MGRRVERKAEMGEETDAFQEGKDITGRVEEETDAFQEGMLSLGNLRETQE